MKILRRVQVVAGVVVAAAAVGAVSGIIVASFLLTLRIGSLHLSSLWEVVKLGSQAGASFGIFIGLPTTFALLGRVPLTCIARDALISATYGGLAGFALSLAFVPPRPSVGFMLIGSTVGFAIAATRLWAQFRNARQVAAVPSAG